MAKSDSKFHSLSPIDGSCSTPLLLNNRNYAVLKVYNIQVQIMCRALNAVISTAKSSCN